MVTSSPHPLVPGPLLIATAHLSYLPRPLTLLNSANLRPFSVCACVLSSQCCCFCNTPFPHVPLITIPASLAFLNLASASSSSAVQNRSLVTLHLPLALFASQHLLLSLSALPCQSVSFPPPHTPSSDKLAQNPSPRWWLRRLLLIWRRRKKKEEALTALKKSCQPSERTQYVTHRFDALWRGFRFWGWASEGGGLRRPLTLCLLWRALEN